LTEELFAGRIGRPHGLDGSFHVQEAAPELLEVGMTVFVEEGETEIVARKGTAEAPILRLAIAGDRDAAVALRGRSLSVARSGAPELPSDEYWAEDLVGCSVVAGGERVLGSVRRMLAYPSCELLELDDEERGTLIPLVRDAIRSIDLDARRIEVDAEFLGL
jgi:16S rRNA processing protein RimM